MLIHSRYNRQVADSGDILYLMHQTFSEKRVNYKIGLPNYNIMQYQKCFSVTQVQYTERYILRETLASMGGMNLKDV
jgi:hypothetical protein